MSGPALQGNVIVPAENFSASGYKSRCRNPQARRDAILDAASRVLQENGFHGASMDRIAKTSGMSKKTLYQWFESKDDLFRSLISERLLTFHASIDDQSPTLHAQLANSLKSLCREFVSTERLSLLRTVIAENTTDEVRHVVSELFKMKCTTFPLRNWIAQQNAAGRIHCPDIALSTDLLFGMTLGLITMGELTGCNADLPETEHDRIIDQAVAVFLTSVVAKRPN